jgi:membrane associated rhomboid family serine protease
MRKDNGNNPAAIAQELKTHAMILGGLVIFMWALEIVDFLIGGRLNFYGIYPRTYLGLRGILFAPFLHGNFRHLISNTVPFLIMGWFVMLREISDFFLVSAIALLASGFGVWLFGAPGSLHIGASGVIFGYFGFLLARAYFERSALSIALAITVGLLYGGLIWGVLPSQVGISWEGHLFGFLGGVLAANWLAREAR